MKELKNFPLSQLKQLIESDDAAVVDNYISQNLAIARNVRLSLVKSQFGQGPLQMPEMRILILKSGWVEPIVNLTPQRFEAGDLIFLGKNGIVQFRNASDDVQGLGLSMSDELFSLAIGSLVPKAFDGHLRQFSLHLQPDEQSFLEQIHHLLYINTRAEGHSSQVTLRLLSTFLYYVDHLWSRHEAANRQSQTREQRLFSDFVQLVGQYAPQQHNIDFYAGRLCLSPRYMSTIVKRVSGRAAKQWIDDAIITQAKIDLKHTEKSVAQIADGMRFPNPSFFSKYFHRLTGMTPLEYRNS